jgi:hypothetical protein
MRRLRSKYADGVHPTNCTVEDATGRDDGDARAGRGRTRARSGRVVSERVHGATAAATNHLLRRVRFLCGAGPADAGKYSCTKLVASYEQ